MGRKNLKINGAGMKLLDECSWIPEFKIMRVTTDERRNKRYFIRTGEFSLQVLIYLGN